MYSCGTQLTSSMPMYSLHSSNFEFKIFVSLGSSAMPTLT